MNILGISGSTNWDPNKNPENWVHGSSASLIIDGVYIGSLEEERFSRIKYDGNFPIRSIDNILHRYNLIYDDIDIVCFVTTTCGKLTTPKFFEDPKISGIINSPEKKISVMPKFEKYASEKISDFLKIKFKKSKIKFVDHHLAHASISFLTSNFEKSFVLTLDGGGDIYHTTSLFDIKPETIKKNLVCTIPRVNVGSIGLHMNRDYLNIDSFYDLMDVGRFYGMFSSQIIRMIYQKTKTTEIEDLILSETAPGKIMGLSAYGKMNPSIEKDMLFDIMKIYDDSIPKVNIHKAKICDLLYHSYLNNVITIEDWAHTGQCLFEEIILGYCKNLPKYIRNYKNLSFGGGCAFNILLNTKIIENGIFENVHIPTAPNDNGLSLGAALYVANELEKEIKIPTNIACVGLDYSDVKVTTALKDKSNKISFKELSDFELYDTAATLLKENKIIAWHQGRSEYGPRALGNRSIFANPSFDNKQHLNEKVKFRESWRPYAGMVMLEHLHDWFILPRKDSHYMLFNSIVRENKRRLLKSVTHVDNSCRVQSVSEEINKRAYKLLEKFYEKTGIPVLLNTSFNTIPGEPIVETPEDALKSFLYSKIDVLFINNFMVTKI